MEAQILDGARYSEELRASIRKRVEALQTLHGIKTGLAVILVGNNPASEIYVRNKEKGCLETGIFSETIRLPEQTGQETLESEIERLNHDNRIHGILVQLPLPGHLNEAAALARILPEKDVDGFHLINAGRLMTGQDGVIPCTPRGALYMIQQTGMNLNGMHAVVVGRSNIVGKPMAMLLLQQNCTVTICHSRTKNLEEYTRKADILIAAIGKPRFFTSDMVKQGAIVIDVGINRVDGRIYGDVDFENVRKKASWITPVPGGVGKMTITMLLQNTLEAAERVLR